MSRATPGPPCGELFSSNKVFAQAGNGIFFFAEISHVEISFASEKIAAFSTSFYNDWLGSPEPSGGWSWHTLDGPQLERSGVFHRIL